MNFLENTILTPLRKDGFSQEWLENAPFSEIFDQFIYLSNRNLIEKANFWFTSKLRDIEQEVNEKDKGSDGELLERSQSKKEKIRKKLYLKHFKDKKKNE